MYGERINKCHLIRAADFGDRQQQQQQDQNGANYDDRDRNS